MVRGHLRDSHDECVLFWRSHEGQETVITVSLVVFHFGIMGVPSTYCETYVIKHETICEKMYCDVNLLYEKIWVFMSS